MVDPQAIMDASMNIFGDGEHTQANTMFPPTTISVTVETTKPVLAVPISTVIAISFGTVAALVILIGVAVIIVCIRHKKHKRRRRWRGRPMTTTM